MNDLSLYVYVKKWIIVVIVNKLILIYFTWFVHDFVNHKYNVLLKRNDAFLMLLNTFVCVCMCMCVCVCVSRTFTVKTSSVWNSWNVREQINHVALKTFLSSAFITILAPSQPLYPVHTLEVGKATNQLGCVSLAKNWIQYSSNF